MTKRKTNSYLSFLLLTLLLSCVHSMNERRETSNKLIEKAKKGDIDAYHDLKILYLDYKPSDFIPIAKFMVDSVSYSPANVDIVQKYFELYNTYPDDTLNLAQLTIEEKKEFTKYYNNAVNDSLPEIYKYKIEW